MSWNNLAWYRATAPGAGRADGRRAVTEAERALAVLEARTPAVEPSRALYLDTLAAAHFAAGEVREAVEVQRRALALRVPENRREEFEERLRRYEAAPGD